MLTHTFSCTYGGRSMKKKRRGVKVGNVMWSSPFRSVSPGGETPQLLHRINISYVNNCKMFIT